MIVRSGGFTKMVCCDCGLVHLWVLKVKRGKMQADDFVEIIVSRDDKETDKIRKATVQKNMPRPGVVAAVEAANKSGGGR